MQKEQYSEQLIKRTQRFWLKHGGRELTKDEAIECIHNVRAYFKILIQWDRERVRGEDATESNPDIDRK